MKAKLTPKQREEARALYLSNTDLSVDAVAQSYGVGRTVMLNVLKGITRPRGARPKTDMTTEEMIRLHDQDGLSCYYIAQMCGLTESGVWRRIDTARKRSA